MSQHIEERFEGSLPLVGEDGRPLKVNLYITYTVFRPSSGGEAKLPGAYRIELEDGSAVEKLEGDTFRLVATGEVLRLAL